MHTARSPAFRGKAPILKLRHRPTQDASSHGISLCLLPCAYSHMFTAKNIVIIHHFFVFVKGYQHIFKCIFHFLWSMWTPKGWLALSKPPLIRFYGKITLLSSFSLPMQPQPSKEVASCHPWRKHNPYLGLGLVHLDLGSWHLLLQVQRWSLLPIRQP